MTISEPPRPTDALSVVDSINHALNDYELGPDAMRWTPDADDLPDPDPHVLLGGLPLFVLPRRGSTIVLRVVFDTRPIIESMGRLQRALAQMVADAAPMLDRLAHELAHWRRSPTRCPRCNPRGNPPALAASIRGHEYHRRTKRRHHR